MIKPPIVFREYLSWPILLGLIAGFFELTTYLPYPALFVLSSFSTICLYVSSFRYGWRVGMVSAVVAYTLSCSIFLLKPGLLSDTVVLLKGVGFTAFKFLLPVAISSILHKKPCGKILEKAANIYGYMSVLLLVVLIFFYQINIGVDHIISTISDLQNQALELSKGNDKGKILEVYIQVLQFIPGLSIFDFIKNQAFQFLLVFYYFYIRSKRVSPEDVFGFFHLDRFWLYIMLLCIVGTLFSISVFWSYMSFNIFIVVLPLFLFNGFDVLYQRLSCKGIKKRSIVLILLFSYIFGWPLLLILCIGLIDQFYSLRLLKRQN